MKNGRTAKKIITSIRIDAALKKKIEMIAKKNRRSMNNMICHALDLWVQDSKTRKQV